MQNTDLKTTIGLASLWFVGLRQAVLLDIENQWFNTAQNICKIAEASFDKLMDRPRCVWPQLLFRTEGTHRE